MVVSIVLFDLAVDCGHISTPQNGSKIGEGTTFPQSVEFICDEGFVMLGSKVRSCRASGAWSGVQPLCKGKRIRITEKKLYRVLSNGELTNSRAVKDYRNERKEFMENS